ncbi:hypothetical protein FSARC_8915 [Fusarium sarcochroum]|uniref:BTB domain-containing protein n=1 Tax=Fusarium sarcochroum TaxID=1208366 RepID=A0A8H4TSA0_9HYPO|nr:hypothetical protein FSARC_8915 [Fusarium sarcochroum]
MNRVSKKTIATSKPFTFIVGPDQTEYTIHSKLVQHQSPALAALVNGGFKESSEFCVKWDDVDEMTFNSFWQFVYTDDYDTPVSIPASSEVGSEEKRDMPDDDADAGKKTPEEDPSIPSLVETLKQVLKTLDEPSEKPEGGKMEKKSEKNTAREILLWHVFFASWSFTWDDLEVNHALLERSNSLVHHARVFILADRYGVKRLMGISLSKLHDELATEVVLSEKDMERVVELIRFTFEKPVPEKLRELVIRYTVCVVEELWQHEEFQELVEDNGALSKALVGIMLLRLD